MVFYICRYQEQASNTIPLKKGKLYYIEAINKEANDAENLSVGVQLPDGKKVFPITSDLLRTQREGCWSLFIHSLFINLSIHFSIHPSIHSFIRSFI